MKGGPDGGVLGDGVLELDEDEGEAVDEEHHVWPPDVMVLGDGELADGEPVVVVLIFEVEHAGLGAADGAVFAAELYCDAVHEHPVEGAVARLQGWSLGPGELAEGFLDGFGGERRVEQSECLAQSIFEKDLLVCLTFGIYCIGPEFAAVTDHPSEALQPAEGGLFDDGLVHLAYDAPLEKGSSSATPVRSTSAVLRVTKVMPRTLAVAAMRPSREEIGSGVFILPHSSAIS